MLRPSWKLSIKSLIRGYWLRIMVTWLLTLLETSLFALMPLLIGRSIDGLLQDRWLPFQYLVATLAGLLLVAVGRRLFDTRAYGGIRVDLGIAQSERGKDLPVSVTNARILMGRELVDFLEETAPESMTAAVQVVVSVVILWSFHGHLALSAVVACVAMLLIYAMFTRGFLAANAGLNEAAEGQVRVLEARSPKELAAHFAGLRRQEVRLSDLEAVVYGLIFLGLLSMLAFNLWYAATRIQASAGQIFSVVSYSLELLQSAVMLPFALQSLTRLREITQRINRNEHDTAS